MAQEWFINCKDCGKPFGYSDASQQIGASRGLSRPERCANCRKLHSREISTLGLTHFELVPTSDPPVAGIQAGKLGRLKRDPRVHQLHKKQPSYDFDKFGIKDKHIREFFKMLEQHQVMVIVAPTGAGKSTLLPYRLMVPPEGFPPDLFTRFGQIIVTQPRTQATRNIPAFVAQDLHGSSLGAGFDVGFQHHGNPATDWRNKLVYMTDGTLINMIVRNELGRLGVIMIDEAHERSVNIDLILGLLKIQMQRFPKLKLIIASATINTELFVKYFGSATVGFYEFPGKREYPVDTRFYDGNPILRPQVPAMVMAKAVAQKVLDLLKAMARGEEAMCGDILAFLQGEKPIRRAVELICEGIEDDSNLCGKVEVLPLYTKLPQHEQDAALKPKRDASKRRVVVSTNVAETSLTVEGIVHVVDSGLINESKWDPETQTTFVEATIHSRAGCQQRWGRAGRKEPGVAHCLYTQEQFDNPDIFPAHTTSEITRAPLEQIVLTAKAAGVTDILTFPWIEQPSAAELARAPLVLRQMGAVDAEGDLTEHGLELRSFAEEPDIANLMILADRFGCAVEMATLIPMRKLGGYNSLLLWDKSWDAPTKRAVHRIHLGLRKPCIDDIEFSLKIWEAWEGIASGGATNAERERWAAYFFVNHSVFANKIAPERATLLQALSGHKKETESRPINFDLLTRLRIVMTYGLPNQIYRLNISNEVDERGTSAYIPHIQDSNTECAIAKLHKNAAVEITPESVCFGREDNLELFVCGKRQRLNRRESALKPAETKLTVSFLTVIKPDWLRVIGQPIVEVARLIAVETRRQDGSHIQTGALSRMMIDQRYPIGSSFRCRQSGPNGIATIREFIGKAPPIPLRGSFDEVEAPEILEVEEAEDALAETAGAKDEIKRRVSFSQTEEQDAPVWVETEEDDETHSIGSRKWSEELPELPAKIVNSIGNTDECEARVVDFDLTDFASPIVVFEIPPANSPFEVFRTKYKVGDTVTVEVVGVERYVSDWLAYLIVREVETGIEIVMDPYDGSLLGRNFALEEPSLHSGARFKAIVEEISPSAEIQPRQGSARAPNPYLGRVRIHRLKEAAEAAVAFLGKVKERTVDAKIVEISDKGIYLWLDPAAQKGGVPCGAFVFTDRLPQRPDEMSINKTCRVRVAQKSLSDRPLHRRIGGRNSEVDAALSRHRWSSDLKWDGAERMFVINKRMSYDERCRLMDISRDAEYRRAVNWLFRRSNEFDVRVIDMTLLTTLASKKDQEAVKGKVVSVVNEVIFVSIEGGADLPVPRREVTIESKQKLRDVVREGVEIDLHVCDVNLEEGIANLSALHRSSFRISSQLVGKVVGRGGNEIKRLESLTKTRIAIEADIVTVVADNISALQYAFDEIEKTVSFASAVIQVSPRLAFKVIGTGGTTKKMIIAATDAYIKMQEGIDGKFNGLVDVKAPTESQIHRVLQLIQSLADASAAFLVPPRLSERITPVPSSKPRKSPKATTQSQKSTESKSRVIVKNSEIPRPPSKLQDSSRNSERLWKTTPESVRKLTARPLGFFKALFGGQPETSIVQRTEENFGVKITAQANGLVRINGNSTLALEKAEAALQRAIG